jgi:hypothetical protein
MCPIATVDLFIYACSLYFLWLALLNLLCDDTMPIFQIRTVLCYCSTHRLPFSFGLPESDCRVLLSLVSLVSLVLQCEPEENGPDYHCSPGKYNMNDIRFWIAVVRLMRVVLVLFLVWGSYRYVSHVADGVVTLDLSHLRTLAPQLYSSLAGERSIFPWRCKFESPSL